MIFSIFGNANPPPLTAACLKLSVSANLVESADSMTTRTSSRVDNRATVMSLVIMSAAGYFVGRLQWDRQKGQWEGSRRYLRDTNLDVITAEAMVWIHYLMGRLWLADQKEDHEIFERVGSGTFFTAAHLALAMIEGIAGFDFKARWKESRRFYLEALKDRSVSYEPFASTVLRSIGCRSLAEPLKTVTPLPPPEWTPLALNVGIFFSTMPAGFYETFKNFLKTWPDRFPHDEDVDDDSPGDDLTN